MGWSTFPERLTAVAGLPEDVAGTRSRCVLDCASARPLEPTALVPGPLTGDRLLGQVMAGDDLAVRERG